MPLIMTHSAQVQPLVRIRAFTTSAGEIDTLLEKEEIESVVTQQVIEAEIEVDDV